MKKKDLIEKRGHKCEFCGRTEWMLNPIPLEIHHVNPPSEKENDLQLLCPNCHALTPNYRGRGRRIRTAKKISDLDLKEAVSKSDNLRQVLINLDLVAKGGNYDVIRRRIVALGLKDEILHKDKSAGKTCIRCGFVFVSNKDMQFCSLTCSNKHNANLPKSRKTKINWPNLNVLEKMTQTLGFCETGRRLDVSDNAVRKRLKNHGMVVERHTQGT